jgi:regulator of replication initiation timing
VLGRSERTTPVELLISKSTISSFFNDLYDLYFLQASIKRRAVELQDAKKEIEEMKEQLDSDLQERQELKTLEEMAKQKVLKQRTDQKNVLTKVKKEESEIVGKMKMTEIDLSRIKEQVTYLMKSGVTVEDAIRYGQLAAIRLGIRPAFLIAVLEIESRLGLNVGKGTWKTDMHPRDYDAFAAICSKLNLDPDKTPVSRKPSYGWGGAMGPAQFLPNTWLAYEEEIAKLTSHNPPSPWNIEDAFTAAAIKLARQGASSKSREGEIAATKAYIGGSSSCSRAICISYANAVLDKAEELEEELGS